ncbi:MAG: HPr family phosphocarrier protein [Alphaproteobacteria bacterium]|nr:HPr family phosphocarrier protein [Alphaproteobacteria bacterium]MBV8548904.1 HPr family phosphocarrier protein [Alphaproteobacteria bacterium]
MMATITNQRGLHARAAARLVREVEPFDAEVFVCKDQMRVSARSIMGLMMLAAKTGTMIRLIGTGKQAAEALQTIADLVKRNFDEE